MARWTPEAAASSDALAPDRSPSTRSSAPRFAPRGARLWADARAGADRRRRRLPASVDLSRRARVAASPSSAASACCNCSYSRTATRDCSNRARSSCRTRSSSSVTRAAIQSRVSLCECRRDPRSILCGDFNARRLWRRPRSRSPRSGSRRRRSNRTSCTASSGTSGCRGSPRHRVVRTGSCPAASCASPCP